MPELPRLEAILARVRALAGEVPEEHEAALLRYAHALELAEKCWEAVPERSIIGRTDRGGQRVHPAIEAAIRAERAAAEFGQALGIEPTGKKATGRPPGAASAPDRAAKPGRRLKAVK